MQRIVLGLMLLFPVVTAATELDILPLGDPEFMYTLGSAEAGSIFDTAAGASLEIDELVGRLAEADVVLLGEEHTAMDQKLLHAEIVEGMAALGRPIVLAMEFFQRSDNAVLGQWSRGEIDDRQLLEATGWYDRGGYRWEYYEPVMNVARTRGMTIVGANVSRDIPRAVNRGGLAGLSDEERREVGEITTDGSPQHRYLISRYFGDTVAILPPGWFENMYAAQCLWDVVMARSILAEVDEGTTVVLVVGSGHIAYDLGIPRRLDDERRAAGLAGLQIATFCPATAPAPDPDGEPSGHPMGGDPAEGESAGGPAQFTRSLADYVGAFLDRGGVEAFPTIGLKLKTDADDRPVVSMIWPDTLAKEVGFASGDLILDVNGTVPENLGDLRFLLAEIEWGQRLGLQVQRGDEIVEVAALLLPTIDTSDMSTVPGFTLEAMVPLNPAAPVPASEQVFPEGLAEWSLVTEDDVPVRAEVRRDEVLDEVHELDQDGRVKRSLYRFAHKDGTVERRYLRDEDGAVIETISLDRTGAMIE
ncbi:MAG: PDZ domain-containing protein [Candidatus Aminicenantes bacterium]|nr:MAG: PDZ domain-containing protein [Candidatus Aminicenantes bacterium]